MKNSSLKIKTLKQTFLFIFFDKILFPSSRMYCNCSGPGFTLHSDIVMPYISNYGSKEQIERFLPEMSAGKCISAIAMTEPGAGRSGLDRRSAKPIRRLPVMCCRSDVTSVFSVIYKV